MKIVTIKTKNLEATKTTGGCGECQTSCQSACKTSCGVLTFKKNTKYFKKII